MSIEKSIQQPATTPWEIVRGSLAALRGRKRNAAELTVSQRVSTLSRDINLLNNARYRGGDALNGIATVDISRAKPGYALLPLTMLSREGSVSKDVTQYTEQGILTSQSESPATMSWIVTYFPKNSGADTERTVFYDDKIDKLGILHEEPGNSLRMYEIPAEQASILAEVEQHFYALFVDGSTVKEMPAYVTGRYAEVPVIS